MKHNIFKEINNDKSFTYNYKKVRSKIMELDDNHVLVI